VWKRGFVRANFNGVIEMLGNQHVNWFLTHSELTLNPIQISFSPKFLFFNALQFDIPQSIGMHYKSLSEGWFGGEGGGFWCGSHVFSSCPYGKVGTHEHLISCVLVFPGCLCWSL
jgi:hypothetical protein